jgi:hypothetical protein
MNYSGPPLESPDSITRDDISHLEFSLGTFVRACQAILGLILAKLMGDNLFIMAAGVRVKFGNLYRIAKNGPPPSAKADNPSEVQEQILQLLKSTAELEGFTLGEVKAMLYVATLQGLQFDCSFNMGWEEAHVEKLRNALVELKEGRWPPKGVEQWIPLLEKVVDFYDRDIKHPRNYL